MRRPLIVGNWKMNGSTVENASFVSDLRSFDVGTASADAALCVPFVYLSQMQVLLQDSPVKCGAQDISVHVDGAYTGEISAAMLVDVGCQYVIVGHSERREYHHESSLLVAQKTLAVQQVGLTPIVCVGETLEQREAGSTLDVIGEQLAAVKSVIGEQGLINTVLAYEPVWAIGTGLTATPEQAQEVHQFIREQLGSAAASTNILYGGSVKPDNAKSLFAQVDIDGALVGGASLKASDFFEIISAA
jgi:triosephosphate isomerase